MDGGAGGATVADGGARPAPFPAFDGERRLRAVLAAWTTAGHGLPPRAGALPPALRARLLRWDRAAVPATIAPALAARLREAAAELRRRRTPVAAEAWLPAAEGAPAVRWRGLLLPCADRTGEATGMVVAGRHDTATVVDPATLALAGAARHGQATPLPPPATAGRDAAAEARTWAALAAAGPIARDRNLLLALAGALAALNDPGAPGSAALAAAVFAPLPDPAERAALAAALARAEADNIPADLLAPVVAAWPGGLAAFAVGGAGPATAPPPAFRLLPLAELLPVRARPAPPAALAA